MKNFFTILLVAFLSYFGMFVTSAAAQSVVAEGGCTDVTVVSGFPYHWGNLYAFIFYTGPCSAITNTPGITMQNKMYLDKLNPETGTWLNAAGPQYPPNNTFSNIQEHGTYRVRILTPLVITATYCLNGYINVYSTNGQLVGYAGNYDYGGETGTFFSNQVVVGNTIPPDISYTFIDEGANSSDYSYDYGDVVKIDTEKSINYNYWWVAIFELDSPNRWNSRGWTHGAVPNDVVNLTNLWKINHSNWEFDVGKHYKVQFVVENNECKNYPYWNNLDQTFDICPFGKGCRFGIDNRDITLSPNPAGSFVRLQNFEPDLGREYQMVIADVAGRIVKRVPLTSNEVDISGLQNGMFIVSIQREGKRIFTSKLIVNQ
jgi:type IX secretion system substrate protein